MMKFLSITFFVFLMTNAYARDCKVYGISDSPQKLNCTFKNSKLALTCKNGNYYLNKSKVSMAYHLEVEEGSNPLVFRAPDMQLTVVIQSKVDIEAELDKNGKIVLGTCL